MIQIGDLLSKSILAVERGNSEAVAVAAIKGLSRRSRPAEDALIARWIEPHLLKRGADEVVLVESGVPVWAIIIDNRIDANSEP